MPLDLGDYTAQGQPAKQMTDVWHSTAQRKICAQFNHSKELGKLLMSSLCCATLVSCLWSVTHAGSGGSSQAAERVKQQARSKCPSSSFKTLPDFTFRFQVQRIHLLAFEHD